jgi:hypothetical protein
LREAAASVTKRPMIRLASSASGCHWTPSAKRLSVVGLGAVKLLPGHPGGQGARAQADIVVGAVEAAGRPAVVVVAEGLGQVLQERPSRRHVHELHPPADPEEGDVALQGPPHQGDLAGVALGHGVLGLGVRLGGIGGGIDVGAPRQHQPVDQVEDRVGILGQRGIRRDHEREPARALHGVDVGAGQQHRLLVPDAPLGALQGGADPDDGPVGHGS